MDIEDIEQANTEAVLVLLHLLQVPLQDGHTAVSVPIARRIEARLEVSSRERVPPPPERRWSGDERARIALIDLYFRLDNQRAGVAELDEQLKHLISARQFSNATILLEELATGFPGQGAIVARLARLYQDQGRKADAIDRYESLIELQIQSGNQAQARETIQSVLALSPEDPAPFVRLLGQLN